jgi:phosphoribosylaminoimidazole-succinocarboxamide synthase
MRNGKLVLIDEVHTPDSSRFWMKSSYPERFASGKEPESYDKEPLRIWFKEHGYSGEGEPPVMPDEFLATMSELYQGIYEKITGKEFEEFEYPIKARIKENILKAL